MHPSTSNHRIITDINPKSHISEAYRALRTNIQFSAIDRQIKVILVTSAQPGEGKSTTVANLAVVYAQEGKNVLVIDADLRKPTLHHIFNKSNRLGLTNVLVSNYGLNDVIRETHIDNLSLISSGFIPPNPSEILTSKKMDKLIEELREVYDVILIDSPPTLAVTDSQILATKCDGVLFVVNAGKVKRELVKKAKTNLEYVKARILGVVLNNKKRSETDAYYYNYY